MKKYRYGKFKIRDHLIIVVKVLIFLLYSTISAILNLSLLLILTPLVYAIIELLVVCLPFREKFVINDSSIDTFKGKNKNTIPLPSEITLIISPFDVSPPLAERTAFSRQTYILKQRYTVSVINNLPIEETLESLHRNFLRQYTTSTIKSRFDGWKYIYSFVFDIVEFEKIISNRNCTVIIPKSLSNLITTTYPNIKVYIDEAC